MLYKFDQYAPISTYYTVCAKDPNDALRKLKRYLYILAQKDKLSGIKGINFHNYFKWKKAVIYDLPEDYYINEYDELQVMEHERI